MTNAHNVYTQMMSQGNAGEADAPGGPGTADKAARPPKTHIQTHQSDCHQADQHQRGEGRCRPHQGTDGDTTNLHTQPSDKIHHNKTSGPTGL